MQKDQRRDKGRKVRGKAGSAGTGGASVGQSSFTSFWW